MTVFVLAALVLLPSFRETVFGQNAPSAAGAAPLTLDQVVAAMSARNRQQARDLKGYHSRRVYTVRYSGFPPLHAQMEVAMTYTAPDQKAFTVISESGSKWLVSRILHRLTETEAKAQKSVERTTLNEQNYTFSRMEYRQAPDGCSYSLWVEPKHPSDVLYRGQLWLNAKDFGVCRMSISPAKNPSIWIRSTEIHQENEKVGQFWLPSKNSTVSRIRLGGVATLSIVCSAYQVPGRYRLKPLTLRLCTPGGCTGR